MSDVPPRKDANNSWSVAQFENYRVSLTNFLKQRILPLLDANECRRVLIRAPVKSGKREMAEYLAMRDHTYTPLRVHAFVSAFHRTADDSQRSELERHNMKVFSLTQRKKADTCVCWIRTKIAEGKQVVVHLDECDFASGDRQVLNTVYSSIRANPCVTTILYSATPQEVLFSGEVEEDEHQQMIDEVMHTGERIEYDPNSTSYGPASHFCGPARFLDAGLITEATPFFRKNGTSLTLSPQGLEIMAGLRESIAANTKRNILVLRLSYADLGGSRRDKKENKSIYQFLQGWQTIPELNGCMILADKDDKDIPGSADVVKYKINWSDKHFWNVIRTDVPVIVVIDQTSSRSTEWACHDRTYALHDFRNSIIFSVISQAQERVNHYEGRYGGLQPIKVYGHSKSFLLSAGRITYATYMQHEWEARKVDRRTAERLGLENAHYHIRKTSGNHELHPDYPEPVPEAEHQRILQEIGCHAEVKVSSRVRGSMKVVPVYFAKFHPCTKETFPTLLQTLQPRFPSHRFQNPFVASEARGLEDGCRYKGYLRDWKVFDFKRNIETQPGWGVGPDSPRLTICYNDGELGVALRYDTGLTQQKNTMEAFNSMYAH
jgi:hypothetical protein